PYKKIGKPKRSPRQARLAVEDLEGRYLLSASPLTWTAPAKLSTNAVLLTIANGNVEVFDNGQLVASQAVASTSAITLTSVAGSMNTFDIRFTPAGIPTTINLRSPNDQVYVGDDSQSQASPLQSGSPAGAGSGVQNIRGTLTIVGPDNRLTGK